MQARMLSSSRRKVALAIFVVTTLLMGAGIASAVQTTPVAGLVYSADDSHDAAKRIAHASLQPDSSVVIFIGGATGSINAVDYYLDDAIAARPAAHSATAPPFDYPLATAGLSAGVHSVLAVLHTSAGTEHDLFARFGVAESAAAPTVPPTVAPAVPPTVAPGPGEASTSFTFAVMPDTQNEVLRADDPRFLNRTQWLVDNKDALNLKFVTHPGDVMNWDTPDHSQYGIAQAAMRPLEAAGIPYSLAIGNHDTQATGVGGSARDPSKTHELQRDTHVFNTYFTAAQYGGVSGTFEPNKLDNVYSLYNAGGVQWMVLVMELWPRPAAVDWAKQVVAANPNANVIVVTHDYLDGSGNAIEQTNGGYGDTSPQYLYDNLISQYANVRMVFSGHVGETGSREDTGVNGNKIYSFLQTIHSNDTNPVRLVTIDTAANTIKTWVYGPYTNKTYTEADKTVTGVNWVR